MSSSLLVAKDKHPSEHILSYYGYDNHINFRYNHQGNEYVGIKVTKFIGVNDLYNINPLNNTYLYTPNKLFPNTYTQYTIPANSYTNITSLLNIMNAQNAGLTWSFNSTTNVVSVLNNLTTDSIVNCKFYYMLGFAHETQILNIPASSTVTQPNVIDLIPTTFLKFNASFASANTFNNAYVGMLDIVPITSSYNDVFAYQNTHELNFTYIQSDTLINFDVYIVDEDGNAVTFNSPFYLQLSIVHK